MYRLGFFYNLPGNGKPSRDLVMLFDNNQFVFYWIPSNRLPRQYQNLSSSYYNYTMPVICTVKSDTDTKEIDKIYFLKDFPLYPKNNVSHPFSIKANGKSVQSATLLHNKNEFVSAIPISAKEIQLLNLMTRYVYADRMAKKLQEGAHLNLEDDILAIDQHFLLTREIQQILDYDIDTVLSLLYVEVYDYYGYSRAEEDYIYKVYRTAKLVDSTIKLDQYTKDLVGIGEHIEIYKNYGYNCNIEAESLEYKKRYPIGVYEGEILEKEKSRIKSKYSKAAHIAALCNEKVLEARQYDASINLWEHWKQDAFYLLQMKFLHHLTDALPEQLFHVIHEIEWTTFICRINRYLNSLQHLPRYKVAFVGNLQTDPIQNYDVRKKIFQKECFKIVDKVITFLSQDYNVEVLVFEKSIIGQIAYKYAKDHIYDRQIFKKGTSTEEVSKLMSEADRVVIIGDAAPHWQEILDMPSQSRIDIEYIHLENE